MPSQCHNKFLQITLLVVILIIFGCNIIGTCCCDSQDPVESDSNFSLKTRGPKVCGGLHCQPVRHHKVD